MGRIIIDKFVGLPHQNLLIASPYMFLENIKSTKVLGVLQFGLKACHTQRLLLPTYIFK